MNTHLEYPIYCYKKKWLMPLIILGSTVLVFLFFTAPLWGPHVGIGQISDKQMGKLAPFIICFYIVLVCISFIRKSKKETIVIKNNQIIINNIHFNLSTCNIAYGKYGVTVAAGTVCYLNDGDNHIQFCIPELLYEDESKYTKSWVPKVNYYMAETYFMKLITDLTAKFQYKDLANDKNNIDIPTKSITVELKKYPNAGPYIAAVLLSVFLTIISTLLLKLENVPLLLLAVFLITTISFTHYRKKRIKNYLVEIDKNSIHLKEKNSGGAILSVPIHALTFNVFYIQRNLYGPFHEVFNFTILELNIPECRKLKIATRGLHDAFIPKRKWLQEVARGIFYNYTYLLDANSWTRLVKAIQ